MMGPDFARQKGLGPNQNILPHRPMFDPFLQSWTEWVQHDGRGVPRRHFGRVVMIAGICHDGIKSLHPKQALLSEAYAASEQAEPWDWSLGLGGVSGYRLLRLEPLTFCPAELHALTTALTARRASPALKLGLDGVA